VTDSIVARNFPASVAAHTVKFKHDAMSTLDLGNGYTGDATGKRRQDPPRHRQRLGDPPARHRGQGRVRPAGGHVLDRAPAGRLEGQGRLAPIRAREVRSLTYRFPSL
jgi:hypothetical protein